MRNISFAMTTNQIQAGIKTVTRRFGWAFLKPGDFVQPVKKARGLKKGEKIEPLCGPLKIVSIKKEPLNAITKADCILEGFPEMNPTDFVEMLVKKYKCSPTAQITRIQFEFVDKNPEFTQTPYQNIKCPKYIGCMAAAFSQKKILMCGNCENKNAESQDWLANEMAC